MMRLPLLFGGHPVNRGIVEKEEHYVHSSANPRNPLEGWQVAVTDRGFESIRFFDCRHQCPHVWQHL
ncbi:hypothetical protein [Fodinibius sp.]|uniref:hypothetical protein n=1 Tax=Fodinibius sp. TaxID=1872440 RepID=UPI002ACD9500|nr:hypothetical protein [Fodinibius sp.]MDZ7660547.1 hypothetical protein [Fodinibius sp.]